MSTSFETGSGHCSMIYSVSYLVSEIHFIFKIIQWCPLRDIDIWALCEFFCIVIFRTLYFASAVCSLYRFSKLFLQLGCLTLHRSIILVTIKFFSLEKKTAKNLDKNYIIWHSLENSKEKKRKAKRKIPEWTDKGRNR